MLVDCVVLTTVVVVSALPYIAQLGFYSDDWAFLGAFSTTPDQSLTGMFRVMHEETPERPVLSIYFAALYWLLGTDALGYHVVNHGVMLLTAVAFYLCLRRLGVPRVLCLAWPLVFELLPHYSTDRLWYAIFQANLSVALYFVSLYAALAARLAPAHTAAWRTLSIAALGASVMAYEVVAPLFLLNPLLEEWSGRRVPAAMNRRRDTIRFAVVTVAVLAAASVYKTAVSSRVAVDNSDYGQYAHWLLTSALSMSLVDLGWGLPAKVAVILRDYSDRVSLPAAAAICVCVALGLFNAARSSPIEAIKRTTWLGVCAGGLLLIEMGYSTFLITSHVGFSATGMNNRTAIVAAIGVALTFIGIWGAIVSLVPSPLRRATFSLGLALLGVAGALVNMTVASSWLDASVEQRRVVAQLRSDVPTLPPHSSLLLVGLCPYRGPGTVFETDWDVTGMLSLEYRDTTLVGDVVVPSSTVGPDAVITGIYEAATRYPYNDRLLVYDIDRRTLERLPDGHAATQYFEASRKVSRPVCANGVEGSGAPIF